MNKQLLIVTHNRNQEVYEFDDTKTCDAFVEAVYLAKEKLIEASANDSELHDPISDASFNRSFSLTHAKYTDHESDRLKISIDYEARTIYIRYTHGDVQLDIVNHTVGSKKILTVEKLIEILERQPKGTRILIEDHDGRSSEYLKESDVIEAWTRDDTFDPRQEESVMMFTKYKGKK